ncbi:tRNA 2-selenouridine(34) synthase MnmH [Sulfitobacter aestuariivivens]|uniref:tRNA 2-selenouridine(34) synthase MnmH n=1 Tax=Sulfitobacter aestuariivivens TaxID=2766981 RepID=UPI0036179758
MTLTSLTDLAALGADTIIDVRAPAEFAEDHLPGAMNLPVLTDAQRAEVGTIYKQESPFDARKIGGALVAHNTALHLQGPLSGKQGDWQPLVYCWRGGQRSGAFATILDQVGWRVHLLKGGYRSYRKLVVQSLYDTPLAHRLIVIEGGTGTAKTDLLTHLAAQGAQTLDLEALAAHRGSLFGATADPQPAQKLFESRIAATLDPFDPQKPTWVEAESSRIGERTLPPSLWAAMQSASRVEIKAPTAARADYLSSAYRDLTADPDLLATQINKLSPYHAAETISGWHILARAQDWTALAEGLITAHYDPRYTKSAARSATAIRRVELERLDPTSLQRTAKNLIAEIS